MPCCIMGPQRIKTQAVAMPCNFGVRPWVWRTSPGLARGVVGLPRVWRAGFWSRIGLQLWPTPGRHPFLPWRAGPCRDDPLPASGLPPPGRRRKPGSCIDRRHRPWVLLKIWKSRRLGVGLVEEAVPLRATLAPPCRLAAPPGPRRSRFTWWLLTWPSPSLGGRPPPPAPNWLICRCVNKGAAPPPV